jgi:hypothetical protein
MTVVVASYGVPLPWKLVVAATFTDQAIIKSIKTLKSEEFILKDQGPLKIKKTSSGTMGNHKLSIDTTFDPY